MKNKLFVALCLVCILLIAGLITFLEIDRRSFKEVTAITSSSSSDSSSSKSSGGIQGKGEDSESKTDINAIHSQLEAYYAQNGFYPGISQMNNQTFIETNMIGLSFESLKTPDGVSHAFIEVATNENYAYKPSGCNKTSVECTSYTLSALLNTGEKYSKQSLN